MIKPYIRQAFRLLKENRLVSTISIAGTALSVAMIMVVVLLIQIQQTNFTPETKRDRMLYVKGTQIKSKDGKSTNNGNMSVEVVKECFYSLKTAERVTGVSKDDIPVSLPGKRLFKSYPVCYTDTGFWGVFDFRFINGQAFTHTDFASGIPVAVVSETVARNLFGSVDVIGEEILLNFISYRICGVVKEVSQAAADAYAQVWVPYTTHASLVAITPLENLTGYFSTYILVPQGGSFETVCNELARQTAAYNATKNDYQVNFLSNPLTRLDITMGSTNFGKKVSFWQFFATTGSLLLFLLLVPALNLTGVTQAAVQKRKSEMGVRKAFGATFGKLMAQVLWENLVMTLIGGLVGLGLSFVFLGLFRSILFTGETTLQSDMLIKPGVFIAALFFCLLLNLFSAGIPAVKAARSKIVNALKGEE